MRSTSSRPLPLRAVVFAVTCLLVAAVPTLAAASPASHPSFIAAGGGVSAPPVSVGQHLYVSTGATLAAWDLSGRAPRGPVTTGSTPEAGSISAMVARPGYLYAATLGYSPAPDIGVSGGGISTYSLAAPSTPRRLRHTELPEPLGYVSTPHSIASTTKALYAVDQYGAVYTYSLSDPSTPRFVTAVGFSGNFNSYLNQASGASVVGNHLIITGFNDGEDGRYIAVLIYDISHPLAPVVAAYSELAGPGFGPALADSNALAITKDGYGVLYGFRLAIFDLRNPAHITMTYGSTVYPHSGVSAAAAVIHGHYAYIADQPYCVLGNCGAGGRLGTDVWDIANPAKPILARTVPINLSPTTYNGAADSPFGPVFVGADNTVRVLDLHRPTAPVLRYQLPLLTSANETTTTATSAVFDRAGYAYVVGGSDGFSVLKPWKLQPIGRFDSAPNPTLPPTNADLALQGTHAFLLDNQGFSIADIANRRAPRLLAHVLLPQAEGVGKIAVHGHDAYVATTTTLRIYDVSHPTRPRLIAVGPGLYNINGLAARGTHVFLTAQTDSQSAVALYILDVATPSRPTVESHTVGCTTGIFTPNALAVSADGTRAFIAQPGCNRVDIFNTSDAAAPVALASYTPSGSGNTADQVTAVSNTLFYVGTGLGVDLVHLDASGRPTRLQYLTPLPSSAAVVSRAADGELLFFSYDADGVALFREHLPAS